MNTSTKALSLELKNIASRLSKDIDRAAGTHMGFTLLVYTEGRASYISNVAREDAVRELKHLLSIWEAGMPDIPAHEVQ